VLTAEFDYTLPPELIAQQPIEPRDASRLLVLRRAEGTLEHRHFRDLPDYLRPGDLLVANETRVIPARLLAHKVPSGGKVELRESGDQYPEAARLMELANIQPSETCKACGRPLAAELVIDPAKHGEFMTLACELAAKLLRAQYDLSDAELSMLLTIDADGGASWIGQLLSWAGGSQ